MPPRRNQLAEIDFPLPAGRERAGVRRFVPFLDHPILTITIIFIFHPAILPQSPPRSGNARTLDTIFIFPGKFPSNPRFIQCFQPFYDFQKITIFVRPKKTFFVTTQTPYFLQPPCPCPTHGGCPEPVEGPVRSPIRSPRFGVFHAILVQRKVAETQRRKAKGAALNKLRGLHRGKDWILASSFSHSLPLCASAPLRLCVKSIAKNEPIAPPPKKYFHFRLTKSPGSLW